MSNVKFVYGIDDMRALVAYRVVEPSADETFVEGDLIWKSKNGDICCSSGFLTPSEEDKKTTLNFKVVEDINHYVAHDNHSERLLVRPYKIVERDKGIALDPVPFRDSDDGGEGHIGYLCPLCKSLGRNIVVKDGDTWHVDNCPECGVNLAW